MIPNSKQQKHLINNNLQLFHKGDLVHITFQYLTGAHKI